jgi:hypothetical protein
MAYDSARDRVVLFGGAATPLDDPAGVAIALGDTWEQFETGAVAGGGGPPPPPAGPQQSLVQFTITPNVAASGPGNDVIFEVGLSGPAPAPAGQDVDIAIGGGSIGAINVPSGAFLQQVPVTVDSIGPTGSFIQFDATAGGVTLSATLTIV